MDDVTRERYPGWIWPRGESHVVLSAPRSNDVFKTFVEPGGSFSPGVGTFGVSVWVWLTDDRRLVAPELLPREALRDRLLGGTLPLHRSRWRAGPLEIDLRLGVEACPDEHHPLATLLARVKNRAQQPARGTALLVVRSLGPAGGPIRAISYEPDAQGFLIDDVARVLGSRLPAQAGCVSLRTDGVDLSVPLRRGELPTAHAAIDSRGWCGGYLAYPLAIEPGEDWEAAWDFPVRPAEPQPDRAVRERLTLAAADRLDALADGWREELERVKLRVPDPRIAEAFYASLTHLVMAFNGPEPRIATVCYPLLWVRDTVYIINALDKAGLTDWSRPAIDRLAEQLWAGGFGPEADAPGEGLWALGEHFLLTGDAAWLRGQWPRIVERVEWLQRMRRCTQTLRVPAVNILPRARLHPEQDLVCDPAVDGLIHGRMDFHRPLFWVNAFALAGLRHAALLAAACGETATAEAWRQEAAELAAALAAVDLQFGRNDRDTCCALWPTGALRADQATAAAFEAWWRKTRYDDRGTYRGEPRWRYFEVGQAHNLLRLGMRERALLTLEHFLRTQDAPGLYAWAEGDLTGDPTGDWRLIRGWWPTSKILPHGWVQAELALLIRDLFLFEEDQALVIGAGLRPEWLSHEDGAAITAAPTHFGRCSWRLDVHSPGRASLTIRCEPAPPPGGYRLRLPLPPSAVVEYQGAGIREEAGDWPLATDQTEVTVRLTTP